jgi:hypothetical protein
MKMTSTRFAQILREEARRVIKESFEAPAAPAAGSPLQKVDVDKLKSLAASFATSQAKKAVARTAVQGAARAAAGTVGGEAVGTTGLIGAAGEVIGGASATVLAAPALIALGTAGLVGIADAAWDAHVAGVEAKDRNTATAITTGIRKAYTDAIVRGKQQGLWTSQDLAVPGQAMNKKLMKQGTLTKEENAALSIVLSTITPQDISNGFAYGVSGAPVDDKAVAKAQSDFSRMIASIQQEIRSKALTTAVKAPAQS